jgi:rhodanese-related sulfurtransferase
MVHGLAMNLIRALFAFFAAAATMLAAESPSKIEPTDAAKRVADGKAVLVDCREPEEWTETGVAAPAVLLPKSDFDGDQKQWQEFLAKNQGKQIILYCGSGGRAGTIARKLAAKGVNAANAGGLRDWIAAGLPIRAAESTPPAVPKPAPQK